MIISNRQLADKLEVVYDTINSPKRETPQTVVYKMSVILEILETLSECGKYLGKDFDTGQYLPQ